MNLGRKGKNPRDNLPGTIRINILKRHKNKCQMESKHYKHKKNKVQEKTIKES